MASQNFVTRPGSQFIQNGAGVVERTVTDKLRDVVSVKDFGAVGNGTTDDTAAIQSALNTTKPVFVPEGTYKITSSLRVYNSIYGASPTASIFHNYVTTPGGQTVPEACLDVSGASYYSLFENFAVAGQSGNSSTGITTRTQADVDSNSTDNPSYCHYSNIYSYNNAKDGFYLRRAWANSFNMCKFFNNARWGFNVDNQTTSPVEDSATNGCLMVNCEFRHNGPAGSSSAPGSQLGGGIKVSGAAGFWVQGGIVESNEIVGIEIVNLGQSTRSLGFSDLYFEFNGYSQNGGACFYLGSSLDTVFIKNNWVTYGAETLGHTNYFVNNTSSTKVYYENNFTTTVGAGTAVLFNGKSNLDLDEVPSKSSTIFGDTGASGSAVTTDILTATSTGLWLVSGFLHFRRNSDQTGGIFPFVAAYDGATGRFVNLGSSVVSGSTASPSMAFSGDTLQVTTPAYCYAFVFGVEAQITSAPTTFSWNTAVFPTSQIRRK